MYSGKQRSKKTSNEGCILRMSGGNLVWKSKQHSVGDADLVCDFSDLDADPCCPVWSLFDGNGVLEPCSSMKNDVDVELPIVSCDNSCIASGVSAEVFAGRLGNRLVALKALREECDSLLLGVDSEVEILRRTSHPFCVAFLGIGRIDDKEVIVTELCTTSLRRWVRDDRSCFSTATDCGTFIPNRFCIETCMETMCCWTLMTKNVVKRWNGIVCLPKVVA
jgi:hypothetical protein